MKKMLMNFGTRVAKSAHENANKPGMKSLTADTTEIYNEISFSFARLLRNDFKWGTIFHACNACTHT